jgi:selenophosphate synthase
VYSFTNPAVDKQVEMKRALAVFRIHTGTGEYIPLLSEALQNFFKVFTVKVSVSTASAILTEHKDAQFAMFDYIHIHRGDKIGHMPAVTSVTQISDVTKAPDDDIHSNIAMTSSIDLLNLLGCGIPASFKLFPIYDGPSEEILDRIRSNLDAFTSRYNLAMEDYSSLKVGKLFYGTSAMANTTKDLPTKYEQIQEGMEIIITNNFGGLPSLSLYMLAQMQSENVTKYEQNGIAFSNITQAKDEAIKNLSEPHFALGKIIAKYCPDFEATFDNQAHITAVYPVGMRGVFALGSLAEIANAQLTITAIPIKNEEIAKFATRELLVENATASLNGCHLIVATRDIASQIMEELKKHNFSPERIGFVAKKGSASVEFATDVNQFVASKMKLARLKMSDSSNRQTSAGPDMGPATVS